jgi:hypothetical protein
MNTFAPAFAAAQVGTFPLAAGSKDASIVLAPGAYTAHISGVADSTDVALTEIYKIP